MKDMVWERALHEQTMNFSRQGRLGFYAPTYGEEASEMGSIAAFKDRSTFMKLVKTPVSKTLPGPVGKCPSM